MPIVFGIIILFINYLIIKKTRNEIIIQKERGRNEILMEFKLERDRDAIEVRAFVIIDKMDHMVMDMAYVI